MENSPQRIIESFSQVLDCFTLDPNKGLFVNSPDSNEKSKILHYEEACEIAMNVTSIPKDIKPLFEADDCIWKICKEFYPGDEVQGDGEVSSPKNKTIATVLAPTSAGALFMHSQAMPASSIAKAVIFSSLYSDHSLMILPLRISDSYISYSGSTTPGLRIPWKTIQQILEYNKLHEPLIKAGKCIFLPSSLSYSWTSLRDYYISRREAPVHQTISDIQLLPLNNSDSSNIKEAFNQSPLMPFCNLELPCFKGLPPGELAQLAKNETDAFIKFNFFLSKRLKGLDEAQTVDKLQDIVDEIQYEIINLRIEAEKISKLKSLQKAELVFFTFGLGVSTFTHSDIARSIAGVIGSVGLLELIKGQFAYSKEKLNLKKSDFYLPFLLDKKR